MKEQVKLSIIIVNWNTKDYLKKCLESIKQIPRDFLLEVIVIDNHSSDSSPEMVRREFPEIHLIVNSENAGFARANNQALEIAQGKYLLLLNSDTQVKADTLKKAVEFIERHPPAGVVGGKILNPDGSIQPSVRNFPTLGSQILLLLKLHHLFPKFYPFKKYFAQDFDYNLEQEVDQVMGAFFMISKECMETVGFFDEKFWLWFEEVDFCKRAKAKGFKIIYTPEFETIHARGQSFAKLKALKEQIIFNNSLLYYFKKHSNRFNYYLLLFFYPISLFLALLVEILESLKTTNLKSSKLKGWLLN